MFLLFNFSSIFPGGQLTRFATMCGRPSKKSELNGDSVREPARCMESKPLVERMRTAGV